MARPRVSARPAALLGVPSLVAAYASLEAVGVPRLARWALPASTLRRTSTSYAGDRCRNDRDRGRSLARSPRCPGTCGRLADLRHHHAHSDPPPPAPGCGLRSL